MESPESSSNCRNFKVKVFRVTKPGQKRTKRDKNNNQMALIELRSPVRCRFGPDFGAYQPFGQVDIRRFELVVQSAVAHLKILVILRYFLVY